MGVQAVAEAVPIMILQIMTIHRNLVETVLSEAEGVLGPAVQDLIETRGFSEQEAPMAEMDPGYRVAVLK